MAAAVIFRQIPEAAVTGPRHRDVHAVIAGPGEKGFPADVDVEGVVQNVGHQKKRSMYSRQ